MSKVTTAREAAARVKSGDTLMIGGFLQRGTPETLVGALLASDADDLTLISNDTGTPDTLTIELIRAGRVKHIKASYIGYNPETIRLRLEDPANVELMPQGTLAERIRAGGAGIAGFLTPTGVGTICAEGKQIIAMDGREYLLETALKADVAFVRGTVADIYGNCFMRGSVKSFNAIMATAADYVVLEVDEIVDVGALDPEMVTVSGIFIDAVVKAGE